MKPSTEWKEVVAPDEAERLAHYVTEFAALQKRKSAKFGAGRALHRKQLTAAHGVLEVLPDLPAFAANGLFAAPGKHEAWVRLSNGGMDRAADRMPDIRGLSLKVLGINGPGALGNGNTLAQDFLLINAEQFAFAGSVEFMDFVLAASQGNGALLKFLVKRYGLLGGPARLLKLIKSVGKPFSGFATEPLYSAVPIACGPYAVRVRLQPAASNGAADPAAKENWGDDVARRLAKAALQWDLQLQPFVNEQTTPIEDASVNWPSPYTTVARLTLPVQDVGSQAGQDLVDKAESAVFDPWQALIEHRPLGDVQRARKAIYFESQKGRGAV